MASEDDPTIFPDDDFDDSLISDDSSDDSPPPPPLHHHIPAVTVAITPPPPQQILPPPPSSAVASAAPDGRRLFQRLFTDEDEIELLQGFLDFTASRGGATASGHYHDTAAFYDQIKHKLQLDFNKSQLVEKLRRLKKKYRTIVNKMSTTSKEFVFKSPHDHATFLISDKIWSHLSPAAFRGGFSGGNSGGFAVEIDDDDPNPNPNPNISPMPISSFNPVAIAAVTPPRPPNSSYVISQINLNSASPGGGGGGGGSGGGFDMMLTNWGGNGPNGGGLSKLCTRKRSRVASAGKAEEKPMKTDSTDNNLVSDNNNNNNSNAVGNNVGLSSPLQALVEETLKNCLSPVLKDLVNNVVNGATKTADSSGSGGGGVGGVGVGVGGSPGFKGVGELALNAMPLNFSGEMGEKWRKQQIMELEVYSKRLELVQDQIKLSLQELKSMES